MSTHAPQFRNNLFCSEIIPTHDRPSALTSILSHFSYLVHTTYSVQPGKTLFCPWPFTFRPRKSNAPIRLLSFHLPKLVHKYHPSALYRQQVSIIYSTSFLSRSVKTLGLPVAMAGIKRFDEGPSDTPPAICCRVG